MRIKLLWGKWLSQRINNVLISGNFLYDYIKHTNDFSNHVVSSELRVWIFDETMVPLLAQWLHCYHNTEVLDQ